MALSAGEDLICPPSSHLHDPPLYLSSVSGIYYTNDPQPHTATPVCLPHQWFDHIGGFETYVTNSQTSNPVDFDVFYVASLNFHQPRQKARLIERWLGPILILYFVSCDAFTYYTMPSMIRLSVSPQWTIEHWPPLQLCAHMFSFTQPTHALSMMIDCSLSNALKNISTALWPFLGGALRNYKDPFLIFSFDQTLQEWEVMCS